MKDKQVKKAFAVQVAVALGIVGMFALADCVAVGMLVGIGWICMSSDELSRASRK